MSFKDLKKEFDALNPRSLNPGSPEDPDGFTSEAMFRYWLLRLLFEINGNLDSLAADYKAMRQAMEKRNGGK